MTMIREEGKIDGHTYLIDAVHQGVSRGHAVYLLKSSDGGTCLIDSGTKDSARVIYEKLKILEAWPAERVIITHSHWDHTQGLGFLRKKAAETGHIPEVFASEKAGPFLADQSFNICFGTDQAPYDNVNGVLPLKNGQSIEVGRDVKIQIVETPGHMVDHISIWEENTGNLFVGDAIGMKWGDYLIVPNPNSLFWNEKDFRNSIQVIKSLEPRRICLAHFGCLTGLDALSFLDETVSFYEKWMEIFYKNSSRLEDLPFLVDQVWKEVYLFIPDQFKALVLPGLTDAVELAAGAYAQQHS
jgi:glyoxylase-like metal-dependent hydrolase (beta-lactamase superfamily II)